MTQLVKYEAACRAVAEAVSIDEAKEFRDQSEAMRAYAKQAKNKQLEVQAAEIRIRAERRIGELMAAQRDAGMLATGSMGTGSNQHEVRVSEQPAPPTLAEVGIDKSLADRARKYAAIPEQEFNGIVSEWKGRVEQENQRVTVNLLAAGDRAAEQAKDIAPAEDDATAKLRREIGKLTTEAMIDEIIGLRADLSDEKAKGKALRSELAGIKEENALLRQQDLGRALGNEKRRADAAEGRLREHQATAARLQRQVNAQKAEIDRLKKEAENQMIPL